MFERNRGNRSDFRSAPRGDGPQRLGDVLAEVLARYGHQPPERVGASVQPPLVEHTIVLPPPQLDLFAEVPLGASVQTLP
jgi:hypothetical protein